MPSQISRGHGVPTAGTADEPRVELSDVRRYGRLLMQQFVRRARAVDQPTFGP